MAIPTDDFDSLLDQAANGGTGTTTKAGPLVPVRQPGKLYNPQGAGSVNALEYGMGSTAGTTQLLDPNSASVAINGWAEDDQRAMAKKMWYLGLISSPQDLQGAYAAWDNAVQMAARFSAAGNPIPVQDVMEMMADGSPDAIKRRQQRQNGGIVTQKARSINLTDPTTAKALIEQAFQSAYGRDPTDAEVRTMIGSLHAAQNKNPTESTQTSHYDANGNLVSQDTVSSGGIDPSAYLQQQAGADPEAAEYQAATSYFPALLAALGSPAGLG